MKLAKKKKEAREPKSADKRKSREPNPRGLPGIQAPWLVKKTWSQFKIQLEAERTHNTPNWMHHINPAPLLKEPASPLNNSDGGGRLTKRPGPHSAKMDAIRNHVRANEKNILRRLKRSSGLPSRKRIAADIGIALKARSLTSKSCACCAL